MKQNRPMGPGTRNVSEREGKDYRDIPEHVGVPGRRIAINDQRVGLMIEAEE